MRLKLKKIRPGYYQYIHDGETYEIIEKDNRDGWTLYGSVGQTDEWRDTWPNKRSCVIYLKKVIAEIEKRKDRGES